MIESNLLKNLAGYIDGQWQSGDGEETFDVYNPSTGEKLASVPRMGASETKAAIAAGKRAFTNVPDLEQRRQWLQEISSALQDQAGEVGRILCLEYGKPWHEAKGEVSYPASFFDYYGKHIDRLQPRELNEHEKDCTWTVHFRPMGVVGLIVPWNFPIAMIAKKF